MLRKLKVLARDALPRGLQVPLRYIYARMRGYLEPEMDLLPSIVGSDSHVLDVGANRGLYAFRLWKLGARVEVFEPNPGCAALLGSWSKAKERVRVHPVALSSENGSAFLHVPVDDSGFEHDASARIGGFVETNVRSLLVELRSLDSYEFSDLDFIKIDVEGHEGDIFAGATETISACQPAILVEIEQRHHKDRPISDIFHNIEACGYAGFFLLEGKLERITRFDAAKHQSPGSGTRRRTHYHNNFLFISKARIDRGDYRGLALRWMAA